MLQFADEPARDAAFGEYAGLSAEPSGTDRCPSADGSGPWSAPDGSNRGQAVCYVVPDPGSTDGDDLAVMAWSVTGQSFFLTVHDPSRPDLSTLYAWQQQHASHYAAAPSTPAASA